MVQFVTIEGNVGVGKSTLLHALSAITASSELIKFVPEPIEQWRSPIGICPGHDELEEETPLRLLYDDPQRNGFAFQMYATHTRLCKLLETSRTTPMPDVIVMERSCISHADVFGDLVRPDFSALEWHTYQATREMARDIVNHVFGHSNVSHATVYLRTDPTECLRRIQVRGRPEECDHVTLEHMQRMHALHESLFFSSPSSSSQPIYTVDANGSVDAVARDVWQLLTGILAPKRYTQ